MTKKELTENVAKATEMDQTTVGVVVNEMFNQLKSAFISGEKLEFRGFGVFRVQHCAPKPARIITTGERIVVPARKKIKFEASPEILKELNH
jgi:nucleoid DNA-binding protein